MRGAANLRFHRRHISDVQQIGLAAEELLDRRLLLAALELPDHRELGKLEPSPNLRDVDPLGSQELRAHPKHRAGLGDVREAREDLSLHDVHLPIQPDEVGTDLRRRVRSHLLRLEDRDLVGDESLARS